MRTMNTSPTFHKGPPAPKTPKMPPAKPPVTPKKAGRKK